LHTYRRLLQVIILDKQTFLTDFEKLEKVYQEGRDIIDRLLATADPTPKVPSGADALAIANPNKGLSKGTLDTLKPNNLTEESLPQQFFDFNERLNIYMSANGILQLTFAEQRQIAHSFLSTQLWNLIRDRITPNMPVFMAKDDQNYLEGEENSLMELLEKEFRRLHPTVTRRLALMKKSQRAEQSSLAYLSEVKRDAISANLRDVNEEALTCMILINGLSSEDLRSELLDLFDVDQDLSLATIEAGIRKYEANKRTTTYVQNRKSSDLFQVSNYKKGQRQARREYALANYHCKKCDAPGHTSSRCPSNGLEQEGQKSCSNQSPRDDSPDSSYGNKGQKGQKSTTYPAQVNYLTDNSSVEVDEHGSRLVDYVNYMKSLNLT